MRAPHPNVKIIFWGTPEFALPTLEALVAHGYEIAVVVTNPDQPVGRKRALTPPPVKTAALRHGLRVLQPINPISIKKDLAELSPALFVIAAYRKILPKELLDIPPHGCLNIHPSLLPRWRGPSPIQFTILSGDADTGVTIIKMDEKADHGPIVASSKLRTPSSKLTYQQLHDRLAKLGAELLIEILPKWLAGEITPVPQDEAKATYSKILAKDDGRIDWSNPAEEIERMVRAFNPWPGTWTIWPRANRPLRLRIEESEIYPRTYCGQNELRKAQSTIGVVVYEVKPRKMVESSGFAWRTEDGGLAVKTGRGSLLIKKLALEGKKAMSAEEFLRGRPDFIGAALG